MAGNVTRAYQLAAQPWVVYASDAADAALVEYLQDLTALGSEASDLKDTENPLLLWAAPLADSLDTGGSAFVVSAEVYKRIQTRRYVGSSASVLDDTADPA
jgi:hypothetical protein